MCFTCGATNVPMNAGHFVHNAPLELYFYEKNVHCQCVRCNLYMSGRLDLYSVQLEKKYGYGILQELQALKYKTTRAFDFDGLYDRYTEKVKGLSS